MIKRSELKKDQIVRIQTEMNDTSFWSRLAKGRYYRVTFPATEPDDAKSWNECTGNVIMYGVNFAKNCSNSIMESISDKESDSVNLILASKREFKEIFRIGTRIDRLMDEITDACDNLEAYHLNLWDICDKDHLKGMIIDMFYNCHSEEESIDLDDVEEVVDMWDELEELLIKLDELEDKIVRGIKYNVIKN